MRRLCLTILATFLLAAPARGDGGTVRISERAGPYRVTVFTSPSPLRAGPVDVSVLVQDGETGELATDVRVTVRAAPTTQPTAEITQLERGLADPSRVEQSRRSVHDDPDPSQTRPAL